MIHERKERKRTLTINERGRNPIFSGYHVQHDAETDHQKRERRTRKAGDEQEEGVREGIAVIRKEGAKGDNRKEADEKMEKRAKREEERNLFSFSSKCCVNISFRPR